MEGGRGRNLLPSILPRMSGEVQVIPVYDIYIQQLNKKKLKRGVIVSDSDSKAYKSYKIKSQNNILYNIISFNDFFEEQILKL